MIILMVDAAATVAFAVPGLGGGPQTARPGGRMQGMPAIVSVPMGVITATFGGVLRDVVCNEVPHAFKDHRPYAVCAFAGGWVLVGASLLAAPGAAGLLLAAGTTVTLRIASLALDVRLPGWRAGDKLER